jgi:DNA-binding transcriptional ArsR family regulator
LSTVKIVREGETCEVRCLNPGKVRRVAKLFPKTETLSELSDLFQLLSDPNRIKILYALSREEVCVCDLSALLGMSDSAVSHQLRLLRALRLVRSRKDGRVVYYSLSDDHVTKLLEMCLEHENE